ncbi:IS1239%2C transposase%2C putative [Streptococcus pneumoniae]|nr:IS1239%2C transposase%2C putative [Streptococcus pneumoniae]
MPLYLEKLLKLSTLKSSVGQSDNVLEKGASKRFILPTTLNSLKKLKEKILHYHNQKFSPEMMVMAKGVNVGISTIYYWIHRGKLGLSKQDLLYPRKGKSLKKQASPNFKPAGQSIES